MREKNKNKPLLKCDYALAFVFMVILSIFFSGCRKGPFSPVARVMIKEISPNPLGPTSISGTSEVDIPLCAITLESRNEIPTYITGYSIKFTKRDGAEMEDHFKRNGALTYYAQGDGEITIKLEVFTKELFFSLSDSMMPAEAIIDIFGRDENDNLWNVRGIVPLTLNSKL